MSFCVLTIISFISPAQASTFGQAPTVSYAVDLNDPQEQEHVNPYGLFPQPFRFKSRSDRPHISTSEGPRAASVHGWWDQVSGPARTATVRIELWAKGPHDQGFRKVGTGTKNSIPGGAVAEIGLPHVLSARITVKRYFEATSMWRSTMMLMPLAWSGA